ncbi:hypothetical protein [Candidatus Korobacter versatilis]|nr:hypothetical protein [Candidatus Koribacter versatilis]
MEPKQPDRWRGERMKMWGVMFVVLLIILFLLVRHALEQPR